MAIDFNTINNAVYGTDATSTKKNDALGKDEFLKLLIVQMQNQDPLEPQTDTEFIAQLAQFSSLEQMTNMSNTMALNSAIGLIGASVQWTDADGNLNMGVVTSAKSNSGVAQVMIGDIAVDLDKVKVVTNDGTPLYAATALIGSQVTWMGADGEKYNGVVDSVKVINNYPVLVVGDKLVDVNSVVDVQSQQTSSNVNKETAEAMKLIDSRITWKDTDGNVYSGRVYGVQVFDEKPYYVISDSNNGLTYVNPDNVISSTSVEEKIKEALKLVGSKVSWEDQYGALQTGYANSVKMDEESYVYLVVGSELVRLDQLK